VSDFKHGFRVLLRTPLFTICTIAALAIGIGATTALFSVVHALMIKPLPYRRCRIAGRDVGAQPAAQPAAQRDQPGEFPAWRERSRSFEAWRRSRQNRVTLTGAASRRSCATDRRPRTSSTCSAWRRRSGADSRRRGSRGRAHDDRLSHAAWLRQFGGSTASIGASTINGEPVTIVGVMPRGFRDLRLPADAYMPYRTSSRSAVRAAA
jgi:putative ABC transport system permease protein